jgi:hypothetical protein
VIGSSTRIQAVLRNAGDLEAWVATEVGSQHLEHRPAVVGDQHRDRRPSSIGFARSPKAIEGWQSPPRMFSPSVAVMSDMHVVPKQGQWTVEETGVGDLGTFPSQHAAIEVGRGRAQQEHAELFIHDEHGRMFDRSSFGHDPRGGG